MAVAAAVACASSEPSRKDEPIDIHQFKHASDDDPPAVVQPAAEAGQPSSYWQQLAADFHQVWQIPQSPHTAAAAVGCFHIEPDGRISGIKLEASGDQALDDSVQRAFQTIQNTRNVRPQPVPTEQLSVIRKWVCFRLNPNQ